MYNLPLLCGFCAFLCFLVCIISYARALRVALFEVSAFIVGDRILRQRSMLSFGVMRGVTRSFSRFTLNVAVGCQLVLIILFIAVLTLRAGMRPVAGVSPQVVPDALSFSFAGLTLFIFLLCFALLLKETHRNLMLWCGILFLLEGFLLSAFLTTHILVFYVSFEATLLPMYLLIGCWGSRARKIKANYYFFLYTLLGSLITLIGLILLYRGTGSFSFDVITSRLSDSRTAGVCSLFGTAGDRLLWLLLSVGFLFKLPLFVFHLWLPEAHVEAPTVGSIILAALLLKLGVYGFVRLPFTFFPDGTSFWFPGLFPFILLGLVYPAAIAVVHDDMKKIIAYSSIAHMASVLLGLMTRTVEGVTGSLFLSISHGIVSGGLFAIVGLFYDRYRTRDIKYFGGLGRTMPFAAFLFISLTFGNMGFPFLCNFPGELLIPSSSISRFPWVTGFLGVSFFLTAVYSLRIVNAILSGSAKEAVIVNFYDVTRSEALVLGSIGSAVLVFGSAAAPLLCALSVAARVYIGV